jgi:hypothetical protein
MTDQWLMRVEGGLSAHFKQPSGPSRPGTDWTIGLKRGDATHTVRVRAYLSDDASAHTRKDQQYQAQTVMQYLNDLLTKGWHPDQPKEHVITIGNPLGGRPLGAPPEPKKPWWRFW